MGVSLEYVLTGTGHCGTTWLSQVLDCRWEYAFRQEFLPERLDSWAEISGMAAAHLKDPRFPNVPVIHVTRDPLKVYRSMYYKQGADAPAFRDRIWVDKVLGCKTSCDRAVFCAEFLVRWNEMIEHSAPAKGVARMDFTTVPNYLAERTGRVFTEPEGVYMRRHADPKAPEVTARDLPRSPWSSKLIEMAERYGY